MNGFGSTVPTVKVVFKRTTEAGFIVRILNVVKQQSILKIENRTFIIVDSATDNFFLKGDNDA